MESGIHLRIDLKTVCQKNIQIIIIIIIIIIIMMMMIMIVKLTTNECNRVERPGKP